MGLLREDWLPKCKMRRVHIHWTGGSNTVSELDKTHYHLVIEGDGNIVKGYHSIADNEPPIGSDYAAHTLGANSYAIGISLCGMANATPSNYGAFPIKKLQWEVAAKVAAELCQFYDIDVSPQTVLQHAEAGPNLGKPQKGKWDVSVLPWSPDMSPNEVFADFRKRVNAAMVEEDDEPPIKITGMVLGKTVEAFLIDSQAVFAIGPVKAELKVEEINLKQGTVTFGGKHPGELPLYLIGGKGFVPAKAFVKLFELGLVYKNATKTLTIG